jgi:hypothetical protein
MSNADPDQIRKEWNKTADELGVVEVDAPGSDQMPIEGDVAERLNYVENRSDPLFGPVPPDDTARPLSVFGDLSDSELKMFDQMSPEKKKAFLEARDTARDYYNALDRTRLAQQVAVPAQESPTFKSDQVDVAELLSAQAKFIEEQSRFLEVGSQLTGSQYIGALTHYSKAQSMLMKAQGDVLRQLGVV